MHIEDQYAYEAAVRRKILQNARKTQPTKLEKFRENFPDVVAFLFSCGEFENRRNPNNSFGEMLRDFERRLQDFGNLSEKQVTVVKKAIEKHREWKAEQAEIDAEKAEITNFIGNVGNRMNFDVLVVKTINLDTQYGAMTVNICEDENGNIIIYRGNPWVAGEKLSFVATVKEHTVYRGMKQTIVNRPSKITKI